MKNKEMVLGLLDKIRNASNSHDIASLSCDLLALILEEDKIMEELKVGNVVILKSGGPEMTVVAIGEDGLVLCRWFNGTVFTSDWFVPETLKRL